MTVVECGTVVCGTAVACGTVVACGTAVVCGTVAAWVRVVAACYAGGSNCGVDFAWRRLPAKPIT